MANKEYKFQIVSRNGMAELGRKFGLALQHADVQPPWFVSMGHDTRAGKSLFAFGIDSAYDPCAYPGWHVPKRLRAGQALSAERDGAKVIFQNFYRAFAESQQEFDKTLEEIQQESPEAQVFCFSSLHRAGPHEVPDYSKEMDSLKLHVAIDFYASPNHADYCRMLQIYGDGIAEDDEGFFVELRIYVPEESPLNRPLERLETEQSRFVEGLAASIAAEKRKSFYNRLYKRIGLPALDADMV